MRLHPVRSDPGLALTSLIFPTYNPGEGIVDLFAEVRRFLNQIPGRWEILYVCDGCTDGTPERLRQLIAGAGEPVFRVHSYSRNQGKGYAVREGLRLARGQWRIFTDVDLSYLEGVPRVAERLWAGADAVCSSRLLRESSFVVPARLQDYAYRRRLQSVVFSILVGLILGLRASDTQAGLKGFSARAVDLIFPYLHLDGFAFDSELILACRHVGLSLEEVPVQFVYRDNCSTTSFRKTVQMVRDLWRLRYRSRRWAPPPAIPLIPGQPASAVSPRARSA